MALLGVVLGVVVWYVGYRAITSLWRSPFALFYGLMFVVLVAAGVLTSALGLPEPMYLAICVVPMALTLMVVIPRFRERGRARR